MSEIIEEAGEKCESIKEVAGITIGANYFSPYVKGAMRPDYVDEENNYVIFCHNPGWVGNWFWKTSISNFKEQFSLTKPAEMKRGTVAGVSAVQVSLDFKSYMHIRNRTFC